MKLRIKGNSLRLRVSQVDTAALLRDGRIEETIRFAAAPEATLTYALEHAPGGSVIAVQYCGQRVAVVLSTDAAMQWAQSDDVGIYGTVRVGSGTLELMVEKDFACLDRADGDDEDAFPHPKMEAVC